jgi:hypothetical protein
LTFFGEFSNIFFIFSWIFDKILKYGRKIWENMDEIWKNAKYGKIGKIWTKKFKLLSSNQAKNAFFKLWGIFLFPELSADGWTAKSSSCIVGCDDDEGKEEQMKCSAQIACGVAFRNLDDCLLVESGHWKLKIPNRRKYP